MFVVSYSQIYSFHPSLNLAKIVIFRIFHQNPEEIYDLNHFKQEHVPYFDKITFCQLKDAATAVLACEKSTLLTELFSVELKFNIDTLNNWFLNTIKTKFLESDDNKKQMFIKENHIVPSESTCCICGFLLDAETCGEHQRWYDFIVEMEYLFLRNIYSEKDLQKIFVTTAAALENLLNSYQ